ncbi:MAG: DUF2127 domain-containing protein [Gammaproteobacteria bacterium]|nr:DUF2127 domain-containing protein [Gammaproteobacteria bacterium]
MTAATTSAAVRSRFVNVIAWLTIVGSALILLPLALAAIAAPMIAPADAASVMNTIAIAAGISVVQIVMGVGLLQRRNWARLLLLVSLAAVVIWQAVDLLAPTDVAGLIPESLLDEPGVAQMLVTVHRLMLALSITLILGSGWAMYRFTRADIRKEFGA